MFIELFEANTKVKIQETNKDWGYTIKGVITFSGADAQMAAKEFKKLRKEFNVKEGFLAKEDLSGVSEDEMQDVIFNFSTDLNDIVNEITDEFDVSFSVKFNKFPGQSDFEDIGQ